MATNIETKARPTSPESSADAKWVTKDDVLAALQRIPLVGSLDSVRNAIRRMPGHSADDVASEAETAIAPSDADLTTDDRKRARITRAVDAILRVMGTSFDQLNGLDRMHIRDELKEEGLELKSDT